MFCQKCGNQIPDGSNNCTFCGAPQKVNTSLETGAPNPAPAPAPQPPKKNNNTVLIAIIAVLVAIVLIVVGIFVIKPLIEENSNSSSQSEKDKDKDKDKDEDEDEDKDNDKNNDKEEDLDVNTIDAEATLASYLDLLLDPESDEFIDFLTDGAGLETDDDAAIYAFIAATLGYYNYEIISYEATDDSCIFDVAIDTVDFEDAATYFEETIDLLTNDPEAAEEFSAAMGDIDSYSDEAVAFIVLAAIIEELDVETVTVDAEIELIYDDENGWVLEDASDVLGEIILYDFETAMESINI